MSQLRRIAVWVQETPAGTFRWVLTEVDAEGKLRDVRSSDYEFVTFDGALDEGVDALKDMSADLNAGPRADEEAMASRW